MNASPIRGFDSNRARATILRFQPALNWASLSRDPAPRMTVGFGFDLGRADAAETLARIGLDPTAVRSGRTPLSDDQISELFDVALEAALQVAHARVPGFAAMTPDAQEALLELIMWWGPDGASAVFSEVEALSLPLTTDPPEPSPWFDERPGRPLEGRRHVPASDARCGITFESFGLVAALASDDRDLLHSAEAMLPPGWRAVDGPPTVRFGVWSDGLITVDGARVERSPYAPARLLKLGAIVRHHLATQADRFTFVHAGVVEVAGCGIVMPGRSFTGKSTLVAELVGLGAKYLSDEYAVLDETGLVHPFAKPLSIRDLRHDPLGRLVPVPRERVAPGPVRAGLVVLTSYSCGQRWCPSVRSPAEGALALLRNTVSARLRPESAVSATSRLARGAVFLAGRRGEAAETARALMETALSHADHSNTVPA
jgi:hypothetical protein